MENHQKTTPEETRPLQEEPLTPDQVQPQEEAHEESSGSAHNWFLASAFIFLLSLSIFIFGDSGFIGMGVLGIFPLFASLWAAWMGVNALLKD